MGRFESYPEQLKLRIGRSAEDFKKILAYKKLSNIFRIIIMVMILSYVLIHLKDIEAWKILLKGIPNVHVLRDGSINSWVNSSFAIMHNCCTTALEATVSNRPVVTYIPFDQEYSPQLSNELGHRVVSLEELLSKVNNIFESSKSNDQKKNEIILPDIISKKILFDNNELAAEKIVKIWEKIAKDNLTQSSNLNKFRRILNYDNYKKSLKNFFKNLFKVFAKKTIS